MADPAPYFTWDDVAKVVRGEKRLLAMLAPSDDTSEDHPKFDDNYAVVVDLAEAEFANAGMKLPLPTPLTDAALRNAMIGAFIGTVTQSDSSREEWMDALSTSSAKYLQRIGRGEVPVKGAAIDGSTEANDGSAGRISFNAPAKFRFDIDDENSEINNVFPDLAPLSGGRRGGFGNW